MAMFSHWIEVFKRHHLLPGQQCSLVQHSGFKVPGYARLTGTLNLKQIEKSVRSKFK